MILFVNFAKVGKVDGHYLVSLHSGGRGVVVYALWTGEDESLEEMEDILLKKMKKALRKSSTPFTVV